MSRKPTYLPKKRRRRKVRYQVLIPFLILCALVLYAPFAAYQTFWKKKPVDTSYAVCELTPKKSKELLAKQPEQEQVYEIQDHVFYGEHLGLYANPYEKGAADPLVNKSISFRNLCTDESFVYMIGSDLDKKIPLYELTKGIYEVYISSLMKEDRIYSSEPLLDSFYTITRGGINHKITLIANQKLFYEDDPEFALDRPYLFVEVKEEALPEDYYDIIVDPGHNSYDEGPLVERGHAQNGLIEAEENMKASLVMKEALEAAGLKVKLAREGDAVVNTYGAGGRVEMVFKHHAKYYISNHLNSADAKSAKGSEVFYSSYTSSTLADSILQAITSDSTLKAVGKSVKSPRTKDGNKAIKAGYDGYMMIREPGGLGLGAGELSEKAQTENAPFITGTNYGAQAVLIEYLYMSNADEAKKWKANYEGYVKAAAQGIIDYLKLDINTPAE